MNPLIRKALEDGERLLRRLDTRARERREHAEMDGRLRKYESRKWCDIGGYWRTSEKVVGVDPATKRKAKSRKIRL